jgi:2-oxoacid:acceptor oxidoreductase delta subunit (pyruvate/2-ketoisovalerate family)
MSNKYEVKITGAKDMPPMAASLGKMLYNLTGSWRNIRPVVIPEKCTACSLCWKFCPDFCINIDGDFPVIDYDYCKGCGVCAQECPSEAIVMEEESK